MKATLKFGLGLLGRLIDSNITLTSAGVAFYAMLAVFPGISATIAIWSTFADPEVIRQYLDVASKLIPPEAYSLLNSQIQNWLVSPSAVIGIGTVVSLAISLLSARAGVASLVLGLNVIHGTQPRNSLWSFVFGYILTVVLVGVMLLALATVVVVPLAVRLLPFREVTGYLLSGLPWIGMLLVLLSTLGILYRYGPNVAGRRDPFLSLGSLLATAVWGLSSLGLTYYLSNFASYNKLYGSLGAVFALLLWLYLSAFSVLLGAALNAELAARRSRDTGQGISV